MLILTTPFKAFSTEAFFNFHIPSLATMWSWTFPFRNFFSPATLSLPGIISLMTLASVCSPAIPLWQTFFYTTRFDFLGRTVANITFSKSFRIEFDIFNELNKNVLNSKILCLDILLIYFSNRGRKFLNIRTILPIHQNHNMVWWSILRLNCMTYH